MKKEDNYVETIEYRGIRVPVYFDDPGQQFYGYIDNEEISFGCFNSSYKDDIKYLIDKKLDTIYAFTKPFFGAFLSYFNNGYSGYRDIQLTYRTRILKVFLLSDDHELTESEKQSLISESLTILTKVVNNN